MDEVLIRNALNSMLEATEDDATPIIRRLARVQARAALDTLASAPAGDGVEDASDDGPCTDCYDTGVTIQTERPCSCGAAALARPRAAVGEREA